MLKHTSPFDLNLRLCAPTVFSATASTTPIEFNAASNNMYRCVIDASTHSGYVAGSAEWKLAVEVCATEGGTYLPVSYITLLGTAGKYAIGVAGEQVAMVEPDAAWIRLTATKVGAPGNVTIGAYLGI